MASPQDIIGAPPQNELIDARSVNGANGPLYLVFGKARLTTSWSTFFSTAYQLLLMISQSGTTAHRPVTFLWVGRYFFDTTIGKPIWVTSVSAGVATWQDAAGNVV